MSLLILAHSGEAPTKTGFDRTVIVLMSADGLPCWPGPGPNIDSLWKCRIVVPSAATTVKLATVTDRQTDGQLEEMAIYRICINAAMHTKNCQNDFC